ncbi:MAG: glycosyltransferase family 4 protein [Gemmatimonadales bacterium]
MRVLMFGWEFPPYLAGGLATATVGLVKGLLKTGVEVTLVVPFPVDHNPIPGLRLVGGVECTERLTVHRIPSPLQPYDGVERYQEVFSRTRQCQGSTPTLYGADLFAEVERFGRVAAALAAREPHDVIAVHDWMTFEAGLMARAVSGKPLVTHIHAIEFDRTGGDGHPEIARRERRGMMAADRVVSNSRRLRDLCVDRYEIPAEKVDVVHWGIDAETRSRPVESGASPLGRDTPIVLFLGRVTSQKGPDYFIEMAGKVSRFVPRAHYVVAGSGDMLGDLICRAAELGIADRVHFTGGLAGKDVERVYRMADVCVMPSRSEPFGLVALESLLNGTPVVMPRAAGVAEVVQNAFKVDSWDIDEMTNKVVAILRHPCLRSELSERGRDEMSLPRFTLEEPARLTANTYRHAIG